MRIPRRGRPASVASLALAIFALLGKAAYASDKLVLLPDGELLTVMLVLFVLLIFPVNALIFKPIFSALDARESAISGRRRDADDKQQAATANLQRYEMSIRDARAEAESVRKEQISAARGEQVQSARASRQDAEAKIEQARRELATSLDEARQSLRASSQELARTAAEQILGRTI